MAALSAAKETAFEKVRGLWIAIPTPFTLAGEIDEGGLRKSVDYYIDGLAVDGIFCGGVMGEFWSMTVEERARVHELVVGRRGQSADHGPHRPPHLLGGGPAESSR